jgi:hypothetical protein
MARTTDKELEAICSGLNIATDNRYGFGLDSAYGGMRLVRKNGSVDVSPRLSKGELREWLHAFGTGMNYAIKEGYYAS